MDRFNSFEDLEFHPEGMSQGRMARLYGEPLSNNPHTIGGWMYKSWAAGWSATDMDPDAPKAKINSICQCPHCGGEINPASLLGKGKKKTMTPAARAARKANASLPRKKNPTE